VGQDLPQHVIDGLAGLDISGATGTAYLAATGFPAGSPGLSLFSVDLATGSLDHLGAVEGITTGITGLTVAAGDESLIFADGFESGDTSRW
jgi:hypothetical protein